MKKLSIILGLAVFAMVTLFSCKDESGDYVDQLYTKNQKEAAIKACLKASADTAVSHLCVLDGFYMYDDMAYRIDYSALQSSLFDTLENHGYGDLVDSLILRTNRVAESCGSQIASAFAEAITGLEILDCDYLIDNDDDAITNYFKVYKADDLKAAFQTPVSIRMNLFGVNTLWNDMVLIYMQYTPLTLNFDIQNYVVNTMFDDLIQEMRLEEANIRHNIEHRTETMELLGK